MNYKDIDLSRDDDVAYIELKKTRKGQLLKSHMYNLSELNGGTIILEEVSFEKSDIEKQILRYVVSNGLQRFCVIEQWHKLSVWMVRIFEIDQNGEVVNV